MRGTNGGNPLLDVARRIEGARGLDAVVDRARPVVSDRLTAWPGVADALHGRWLGHALHPLLTDFPLGSWIGATLLDLAGGPGGRRSADRLVGLGIVLAVPTALAGAADWAANADRRVGRVGTAHAALHATALTLYGGSWLLRRRGRRRAGVAVSLVAGTVATASGYLGGHMTLRLQAPPEALSDPSAEVGGAP
ncbi:DUF2231 domain-containing protein [Luteimicrobium sp. NPDC057192]|uniref:DUF2231 domain-containing protein n=1 Tax=Luteimicrobium sp. NPDC057192 TaxID=3346042 RepID=UPI00362CAF12